MPVAIEIEHLSFSYPAALPGAAAAPALSDISLRIDAGEFVALMGPVGAGKTTLCLCLNGLVTQVAGGEARGAVSVFGLNAQTISGAQVAQRIGMVFQDAEVQFFNASVEDEIAFGLEGLNWAPVEIEERIDWALAAVGLSGFRHRSPHGLSGGEQKRLAIATVLAVAPPILVLDEPTAGLDPRGRRDVMQVIGRLAAERNTTVIVATQDSEIVARHASRLIVLKGGRIAFDGTPRDVFAQLAAQDERCIGLPEIAVVAHLLRQRAGLPVDFLTAEEAYEVLSAVGAEVRS